MNLSEASFENAQPRTLDNKIRWLYHYIQTTHTFYVIEVKYVKIHVPAFQAYYFVYSWCEIHAFLT